MSEIEKAIMRLAEGDLTCNCETGYVCGVHNDLRTVIQAALRLDAYMEREREAHEEVMGLLGRCEQAEAIVAVRTCSCGYPGEWCGGCMTKEYEARKQAERERDEAVALLREVWRVLTIRYDTNIGATLVRQIGDLLAKIDGGQP